MNQKESNHQLPATLYIVPTPIGNLADITQRALTILQNVDLIAAEDTRHTKKLLKHFAISKPLISFHDYNEQAKAALLIEKLKQGESIALVSNAGTPLINDPGYHLVKNCYDKGIKVSPLPGACAPIVALSASGLPTNQFCYEGFLPSKSQSRQRLLNRLATETRTIILLETPHRIIHTLTDIVAIFGPEREVVLARELTKIWESIYRANAYELLQAAIKNENYQRGEMILIIAGAKLEMSKNIDIPPIACKTLSLLKTLVPLTTAINLTLQLCENVKKKALYRYALAQQKNDESDES